MAIWRPRVLPFVQTNSLQPRLSQRSHRDLHTIISHAIVNVKVEDSCALHCTLARNRTHTHTHKRFMYTHANVIESHRGEPTSEPKPLTTSVDERNHISIIWNVRQTITSLIGKCQLPYTNLIYKIKKIYIYHTETEREVKSVWMSCSCCPTLCTRSSLWMCGE